MKKIEYMVPAIEEQRTTMLDIVTSLREIGVLYPEKIVSDCSETVERNREVIGSRYLHSVEEAVLVSSYTYEDGVNKTSPYKIINDKLRHEMYQDQVSSKKSYLRLLLKALRKLPRTAPQTLYRGERTRYKNSKGSIVNWNAFTSTSTSMKATQNFLTNQETNKIEGTLFEIRDEWGYSVLDFSEYPDEAGLKK